MLVKAARWRAKTFDYSRQGGSRSQERGLGKRNIKKAIFRRNRETVVGNNEAKREIQKEIAGFRSSYCVGGSLNSIKDVQKNDWPAMS
jgi:hypothetical protein